MNLADKIKFVAGLAKGGKIPPLSDGLGDRFTTFSRAVLESVLDSEKAKDGGENRNPVKGLALVQCVNTDTGAIVPCLAMVIDSGNGKDGVGIIGSFFDPEQSAAHIPASVASITGMLNPGTGELVSLEEFALRMAKTTH